LVYKLQGILKKSLTFYTASLHELQAFLELLAVAAYSQHSFIEDILDEATLRKFAEFVKHLGHSADPKNKTYGKELENDVFSRAVLLLS